MYTFKFNDMFGGRKSWRTMIFKCEAIWIFFANERSSIWYNFIVRLVNIRCVGEGGWGVSFTNSLYAPGSNLGHCHDCLWVSTGDRNSTMAVGWYHGSLLKKLVNNEYPSQHSTNLPLLYDLVHYRLLWELLMYSRS